MNNNENSKLLSKENEKLINISLNLMNTYFYVPNEKKVLEEIIKKLNNSTK